MAHPLTEMIGDVLHIVDVDGIMYATDSYWMAPTPPDVADLLRWWNLDPTFGRYEFDYLDDHAGCDECGQGGGRGPLRRLGEPVKAERLSDIIRKLAGDPLERLRTEDGQTLYVLNAVNRKPLAAFTGVASDDGPFHVYANPSYLQLAFGDWESDTVELRCPGPRSPIWAVTDGPLSCVMPVRL